jgi:hypothetical protein
LTVDLAIDRIILDYSFSGLCCVYYVHLFAIFWFGETAGDDQWRRLTFRFTAESFCGPKPASHQSLGNSVISFCRQIKSKRDVVQY